MCRVAGVVGGGVSGWKVQGYWDTCQAYLTGFSLTAGQGGQGWGLSLDCRSRILTHTGPGRPATLPRGEAWLRRELGRAQRRGRLTKERVFVSPCPGSREEEQHGAYT